MRASNRPLIIGHRGAPSVFPEHTASSYRAAIRAGADLVEPDVVATRDGVLLVRHEAWLNDTTDIQSERAQREFPELVARRHEDGWHAEDFDWSELRQLRAIERIPILRPESDANSGIERCLRLRELMLLTSDEATARGRDCGVVVEFKNDQRTLDLGFDFVELLERELTGLEHLASMRNLRFESFEAPLLDRLATSPWFQRLDAAKRIVLVEDSDLVRAGEEGPERCIDAGLDDAAERFDGLSVRTTLLDASLVARAHARGLEVLTYTLRSEDTFLPPEFHGRAHDYWRALAATGVDGVFADDPAACRAALQIEQVLANDRMS